MYKVAGKQNVKGGSFWATSDLSEQQKVSEVRHEHLNKQEITNNSELEAASGTWPTTNKNWWEKYETTMYSKFSKNW